MVAQAKDSGSGGKAKDTAPAGKARTDKGPGANTSDRVSGNTPSPQAGGQKGPDYVSDFGAGKTKHGPEGKEEALIDHEAKNSFPASDPPGFTAPQADVPRPTVEELERELAKKKREDAGAEGKPAGRSK